MGERPDPLHEGAGSDPELGSRFYGVLTAGGIDVITGDTEETEGHEDKLKLQNLFDELRDKLILRQAPGLDRQGNLDMGIRVKFQPGDASLPMKDRAEVFSRPELTFQFTGEGNLEFELYRRENVTEADEGKRYHTRGIISQNGFSDITRRDLERGNLDTRPVDEEKLVADLVEIMDSDQNEITVSQPRE